MKVLRGFAPDGSRAWGDDKDMQAAFWEDVKGTPAWSRYARDYGTSDTNNAIIVATLETLYGETDEFSANQFLDAMQTAMDSGAIKKRKPVEVAEPAAAPAQGPVDRNGHPLSAAQQKWAFYAEFASTHSSAECRELARTDASFKSFMQKNLEREMNEEGVGDAVVPLNQSASPTKAGLKDERLVAFAEAFRNMSSSDVRSRKSAASNPFGAAQFMKDINDCISLGLI